MNYQLTFLISLKLEAEPAIQYQEKIVEQLKKIGAEIKNISELKEQMLAYEIRGEKKAWLSNLFFSIDPSKTREIKSFVDQESNILRYLIVQPSTKVKSHPRRVPKPQKDKVAEISASLETSAEQPKNAEALDQKINEILNWE